MSTRQYGPFGVSNRQVCTIFVKVGDMLTITVPPGDRVHFGGFLGLIGDANADGRPGERAGDGFPAPDLTKHSLIFRIGTSAWFQGGTNVTNFRAPVDGQIVLHINDDLLTDNTGSWNVTLTRTTRDDINDLPRAASSALLQSTDGNFRFITTGNQGRSSGAGEGDLFILGRDNHLPGLPWDTPQPQGVFENFNHNQLRRQDACLFASWFQGTDGLFWSVFLQGTQVKCMAWHAGLRHRSAVSVANIPGADDCVGPPAMIQTRYGNRGNFDLVYPARGGQMKSRFANNQQRSCEWTTEQVNWDPWASAFGDAGVQVQVVRLMQSSFGNLEVLTVERTAAGRIQLRHWFRHDWPSDALGARWQWLAGDVLPGSDQVRPESIPAFIQSSFRTGGVHGNFEVVAPAARGGLLHWYYDHALRGGWRVAPTINAGGQLVRTVHMIQSNFGARRNNFEVVAEEGELVTLNNPGVGFGKLWFYFCNNDRATNSADGAWGGPIRIA
jgi:hypothetical protein